MKDMTGIPERILLVEDNPGDIRLFLNEFEEFNIPSKIHVVTNGLDALKVLHQKEEYIDFPRPDLLVLDLYLPMKNGIEILSEMSKDKNLREIPVVIFSASDEKELLKNCQYLQLISIIKPINLEEYSEVPKTIMKFWLSLKKK